MSRTRKHRNAHRYARRTCGVCQLARAGRPDRSPPLPRVADINNALATSCPCDRSDPTCEACGCEMGLEGLEL